MSSFELWPLPESYPHRTVIYFGSNLRLIAHVLFLKRWKWLVFKNKSLFRAVNIYKWNSFPTILEFKVKSPIDQPRCFNQYKWVSYTGVRLNFDSFEFRPMRSLFYGLCLRFNGIFMLKNASPMRQVVIVSRPFRRITFGPADELWPYVYIFIVMQGF